MTMFEKYKEDFRQTIARMNVAIDHHDRNKNIMESGRLQVLMDVLRDMGHKVDGSVITDKETGMRRALYITMDGESLGNFTGTTEGLFQVITPEVDAIQEEPYDDEDKK